MDATRTRGLRGWLREHARTVLIALLLALSIRTGFAQAYVVQGPSMEPTLADGQRVLVVKYPFGLTLPASDEALVTWAEPRVGDVVILGSPLDGTDLVKRVVGLPGDRVELREGVVYRNGAPLTTELHGPCTVHSEDCEWTEEAFGDHRWRIRRSPRSAPEEHPLTLVPPGCVFVLGDHRDRSNDSRFFGPVPLSRLRGRVAFLD